MKNILIASMLLLASAAIIPFMGNIVPHGNARASLLNSDYENTRLAVDAVTRNFTLYGSFSAGWGFAPASMSTPGPTIVVEQGDTVDLDPISQDIGIPHRFFVSYTNSSTPTAGDPMSADFTTSTTFQFAATTTIGTYKYYCYYHTLTMWGYFDVVQTGTIPEFQLAVMLSLLVATTIAAALANKRKHQT